MNDFFKTPNFISNSENIECSIDKMDYILEPKSMRGNQSMICSELKHSIAFVEKGLDPNPEYAGLHKRQDADTIYFSMRHSCENFRICAKSKICMESDNAFANLFFDLKGNSEEKKQALQIKINSMNKLDFFSDKWERPIINDVTIEIPDEYTNDVIKKICWFLEYPCPILGHMEYLFPITLANGEIIGVFFVGQIDIVDENGNYVESKTEIRDTFIKDNKHIFDEYINHIENSNEDKMALRTKIEDHITNHEYDKKTPPLKKIFTDDANDRLLFQNRQNEMTIAECFEFLKKTAMQVYEFEKYLATKWTEKQSEYIRTKMDDITNPFFENFPPFFDIGGDIVHGYENKFKECLEDIKKTFNMNSIVVFGKKAFPLVQPDVLKFYAGTTNEDEYSVFLHKDVPDAKTFDPLCSLDNEELFNAFYEPIENIADKILLVYPLWVVKLDIGIHISDDNKKEYKKFIKFLTPYFTKIFSALDAMSAAFRSDKFLQTLYFYEHETKKISEELNDKVIFLRQYQKQYKFIKDHADDIESSTVMIKNIEKIASVVLDSFTPEKAGLEKELVHVYGRLLFKWSRAFRERLNDGGKTIVTSESINWGPKTPRVIYEYWQLLELIVYNLVDNAVKHSHNGTKIYIDYERVFKLSSVAKLTVESYGPQIPIKNEGEKLYMQFEQLEKSKTMGRGLGLYFIKMICERLGWSINHTCDQITEKNKSYMKDFIHNKTEYLNNPVWRTIFTLEMEAKEV